MRFIYSETCQIKHAWGEKFNIKIDKVLDYTVQKQIQEVKEEWDTSIVWRTSFRNKQWKLLFTDMFICTIFDIFLHNSVEGQASNLWVAGSNHAPILLFISLMEFYKCIFGVIEFGIFKTVVVIIF